jgi:hypothetical protein
VYFAYQKMKMIIIYIIKILNNLVEKKEKRGQRPFFYPTNGYRLGNTGNLRSTRAFKPAIASGKKGTGAFYCQTNTDMPRLPLGLLLFTVNPFP